MSKKTKEDTKSAATPEPIDTQAAGNNVVGDDATGVSFDDDDDDEQLSLHDCLALGEVELGLQSSSTSSNNNNNAEEVHRLPLLLRLLSKSRPLSSIPTFSLPKRDHNDDDDDDDAQKSPHKKQQQEQEKDEERDAIIEEAVQRLEDRAAMYSVAEGVEVVACHLAPFVCRKMSKLPPLTKQQQNHNNTKYYCYDTTNLVITASNPASSRFKRRKLSTTGATGTTNPSPNKGASRSGSSPTATAAVGAGNAADGVQVEFFHEEEDDEDDDVDYDDYDNNNNNNANHPTSSQQVPPLRRSTITSGGDHESAALIAGAAEDSQEAFCTKTLSELALLVVRSLSLSSSDLNNSNDAASMSSSSQILSMEDSILSEARVMSSSTMGGVMAVGSDLGATVASLMHHVPVLRHAHVASALCRAAVPQAADLIALKMGANSPAAIPSLLRGCINTLLLSSSSSSAHNNKHQRNNPSIVAAVKQSIRALANLSNREKYRVLTILGRQQQQQPGFFLMDLQLEFALDLEENPLVAACLLIDHLSSSTFSPISTNAAITTSAAFDVASADVADFVDTNEDGGGMMMTMMDGGAMEDSVVGSGGRDDTIAPLSQILAKDPVLLKRTLDNLGKAIVAQINHDDNNSACSSIAEPIGRLCILLSAHLWVLSCLSTDPISPFRESSSNDESTTSSLTKLAASDEVYSLVKAMEKVLSSKDEKSASEDTRPNRSSWDRLYSLLLCVAFANTVHTVALLGNECDKPEPLHRAVLQQCLDALKILFNRTPSRKADSIAARVACACKTSTTSVLGNLVLEILALSADDESNDEYQHNALLSLFDVDSAILKKTCDVVANHMDLDQTITRALEIESFLHDQVIGIQVVNEVDPISNVSETIKELLRKVMAVSESSCQLLTSKHMSSFIENATMYLLSSVEPHHPKLPLTLPMHLEHMATTFCNTIVGKEQCTCNQETAAFFLQLLYSFVFREIEPDSSFSIDPRELPLVQVFTACKALPAGIMHATFRCRLEFYIDRFSPETRGRAEYRLMLTTSPQILAVKPPTRGKPITSKALMQVLRRSITEPTTDPSGIIAERMFLDASLHLCEASLLTTAVGALLSVPRSPPIYISYSTLCRDPLVVLKCPMGCWQRYGLRRVILSILSSLLETNEELLKEMGVHDESCSDFVASRNVLVVRCLVSALVDNRSQDSTLYCAATVGTVRRLVVDTPGLCSVLLKQGLSNEALDWLIAFVPELMEDASGYQNLLSERSTLTATERLLVADGILRIAIASHGDESRSETLTVAALSQLVNAFFLIVGPVGVSVHSLLGEGGGLDATQMARKTAFRMLKSLTRVRGYRTGLRNSCVQILQKLSRLCKGEEVVSNLAVSVPVRQKNILRELQEASSMAASAMGSSL